MSYKNALLLAKHPDPDVSKIGLIVLAETVLKQRPSAQLAHAKLAAHLELPVGRIGAKLKQMEAEGLVSRKSGREGSKGRGGGDSRADFYAPSVPDSGYEENSPARAGPMRKRPVDAQTSTGRQGAGAPPSGSTEQCKTIQPDST